MKLLQIIAGGAFSAGCCFAAGCLVTTWLRLPRSVRFTVGAPVFSLCVFLALICGIGYLPVYLALGASLITAAILLRSFRQTGQPLPAMAWFFRIVIASYALMYFVSALSPEIQPDAASYHLRLVSDYVRLHAFSNRLAFFDLIPQGMEMLFVPAFAIGRHSAAKLVHFAFLLATVPLIRHVCREFGLSDRIGCTAAAIFFLAPVCGVAGTSAYTDAGLVCGCLAVICLLVRWDRERALALLLPAALIAGYCYSIKQTFGCIALMGIVFLIARARRPLPAAAFGIASLIPVLPWTIRAWALCGNPFAPFLNAWFPNPVSTPAVEAALANTFSAFRPSFAWRNALPDYTVRGGHEGLLGPAFLLLPLALLALRTRPGRWLLLASLALALPFLANTGTRFLMPPMAPAAIALASVLPAPAAIALTALQAIGSAPWALDLYDNRKEWRLREIPWRAALRRESETAYLTRSIDDFGVTRLIADNTEPNARVFSFVSLPDAYIPREVLVYWQSALGQRRMDAFTFAMASNGSAAMLVSCNGLPQHSRELRVTADSSMRVLEASLNKGGPAVNSWRSLATGQSFSLPVPTAGNYTAFDLLIWPGTSASAAIQAKSREGNWLDVGSTARISRVKIDLRRDATAALRRAGFHYIFERVAGDPFAPLARDMLRRPAEWGLEAIAPYRDYWLFSIPEETF